ncbi:MAG TPA: hypothetical protein DEB70_09595 [Planctomycetaceae bacterium]|nr:hypothetical protein [Planctomycetaceae bacterium]
MQNVIEFTINIKYLFGRGGGCVFNFLFNVGRGNFFVEVFNQMSNGVDETVSLSSLTIVKCCSNLISYFF